MEIKFYDCTQENLEKVHADYVKRVQDDHSCSICTNVLCIAPYTKPKINNGRPKEFIKTDYKIMTSTMLITWNDGSTLITKEPFVSISFGNISQYSIVKFARMEDIDWNNM